MFRRLVIFVALVGGACGTLETGPTDGSDGSDAGEAGDPGDSALGGDHATDGEPDDAGHEDADAADPVDATTYFLTILHPSVQPTCALAPVCHATGATAPSYQFFGDSGPESYTIFKARKFDYPDGGFEPVVGGHSGTNMTDAQAQQYRKWTSLEHP